MIWRRWLSKCRTCEIADGHYDLTSTAILPLCPYVLLPLWPQTSPWLCFKNKFLFFLWRWYENHQNSIRWPHEDSMFPADSLVDKRDAFGSSSSEENRGDWHLVRCPTIFLLREHRNIMGHQDDNMVSLALTLRYYSAPPEGLATPRRGWGSWPGGSRTLKLAFCESSAPGC